MSYCFEELRQVQSFPRGMACDLLVYFPVVLGGIKNYYHGYCGKFSTVFTVLHKNFSMENT